MKKIQIMTISLLLLGSMEAFGTDAEVAKEVAKVATKVAPEVIKVAKTSFFRSPRFVALATAFTIMTGTIFNHAVDTTGDLTTAPMPRCPFGPMKGYPALFRTTWASLEKKAGVIQPSASEANNTNNDDQDKIATPAPTPQDMNEGTAQSGTPTVDSITPSDSDLSK